MKIVTTPMSKAVVEVVGIRDFKINKNPDEEDGDLAILTSENKTKMDSYVVKLNTFKQIRRSMIELYYYLYDKIDYIPEIDINQAIDNYFKDSEIANKWLNNNKREDLRNKNRDIKVRVYSYFLHDIVKDMGFNVINEDNFLSENKKEQYDLLFKELNMSKPDFDYLIFPDYFNINIDFVEESVKEKIIIVDSHKNVDEDPLKRAEKRYNLFESLSK
ncbi:MAG: hypothetical protein LBM96_09195 [Methanobrevibacter sp.]|jgi:hypothetical protein|nr:hypothetical protein [Candidatus Methanoflexus mossambicus]